MDSVAITMRAVRDPDTGERRDSLSRDWVRYLDRLGFGVRPVPNDVSNPKQVISGEGPDALLLSNGEDIDEYPRRRQTERQLLDAAIEADVPILGVCRGHQFLNDYFGGTVVELRSDGSCKRPHVGQDHVVTIEQSPMQAHLPSRLTVNSYHEQGARPENVAPELQAFAVSDEDGVVEGLYHPDRKMLSIQWHPERQLPTREPTDELVSAFLAGELTW